MQLLTAEGMHKRNAEQLTDCRAVATVIASETVGSIMNVINSDEHALESELARDEHELCTL